MSSRRLTANAPRLSAGRHVYEPDALAILAGLGAASSLWALYLWENLVLARSGWTVLCAAGEEAACAAAWDSPFAFAVHRLTGLPLAGWDLAWSLASFVFPLLGLLRLAQRRPFSSFVWASRWMAVSGIVVVLLLVLVSFSEHAFCPGCMVSYGLIFAYLVVTVMIWDQMSIRDARRGLALAAGAILVGFLLLLQPGLKTPSVPTNEAGGKGFSKSSGTGDPERDRLLTRLVTSLTPQERQMLSDSLYFYRSSPEVKLAAPRVPQESSRGNAGSVRITTFTDVYCDECALLQGTLESLRGQLPPGSFSVEQRYYPLDTDCNPRARVRHGKSVHCLAAAVQICLEGHAKASAFSGELLKQRVELTEDAVYDLAAPYLARPDLERCVVSPEAQARLAEDLALAYRFQIRRAPLVLIDGRRGTTFGPFLSAMVLNRGAAFHPAFEALPEPQPRADFR